MIPCIRNCGYQTSRMVTGHVHDQLLRKAFDILPPLLGQAFATYGVRTTTNNGESIVQESAQASDLILTFAGGARELVVGGQGDELTIGFHAAPALLQVDEPKPLENPRATRYIALGRVQAVTLDQKYARALEKDPSVVKLVRNLEKARLRRALRSERRLAFEPAHVRCADMLYELCTKFGVKTEAGVKIIFPFTMVELASFLNLTSRHLRRFMPEWEKDGIISKDNELIVRDLPGLKKLASPTRSARSSIYDEG